jgi:hypothetical protein
MCLRKPRSPAPACRRPATGFAVATPCRDLFWCVSTVVGGCSAAKDGAVGVGDAAVAAGQLPGSAEFPAERRVAAAVHDPQQRLVERDPVAVGRERERMIDVWAERCATAGRVVDSSAASGTRQIAGPGRDDDPTADPLPGRGVPRVGHVSHVTRCRDSRRREKRTKIVAGGPSKSPRAVSIRRRRSQAKAPVSVITPSGAPLAGMRAARRESQHRKGWKSKDTK